MMRGNVNSAKHPMILLKLSGLDGRSETVAALIDTGYDGNLTVTPEIAEKLAFPFREMRSFELGSGQIKDFPIHDARIEWDGKIIDSLSTIVTEGGVLIGMSLLEGYTLFIDAIDGGEVRIQAR